MASYCPVTDTESGWTCFDCSRPPSVCCCQQWLGILVGNILKSGWLHNPCRWRPAKWDQLRFLPNWLGGCVCVCVCVKIGQPENSEPKKDTLPFQNEVNPWGCQNPTLPTDMKCCFIKLFPKELAKQWYPTSKPRWSFQGTGVVSSFLFWLNISAQPETKPTRAA